MDQAAALMWVHKNIEAFGGDPNQVTLLGQGCGAAMVNMLTISPMVRGRSLDKWMIVFIVNISWIDFEILNSFYCRIYFPLIVEHASHVFIEYFFRFTRFSFGMKFASAPVDIHLTSPGLLINNSFQPTNLFLF